MALSLLLFKEKWNDLLVISAGTVVLQPGESLPLSTTGREARSIILCHSPHLPWLGQMIANLTVFGEAAFAWFARRDWNRACTWEDDGRKTEVEMKTLESFQRHSSMALESAQHVFDDFRRWGYLQAQLDPLGQYLLPQAVPELEVTGEVADKARRLYCGTIGIEFMHLADAARRLWILERFEQEVPEQNRHHILDLLIRADSFEQVLQSRYPGTKRFSLEGNTALIPLLDALLHRAVDQGVLHTVIAMSHRGRLNVMVNIIGKSPAAIFSKFEDIDPRSVLGSGDVKYHIGATGQWKDENAREVDLHLVSNPSHLEAVDPVAMGRARAWQNRVGDAAHGHR